MKNHSSLIDIGFDNGKRRNRDILNVGEDEKEIKTEKREVGNEYFEIIFK